MRYPHVHMNRSPLRPFALLGALLTFAAVAASPAASAAGGDTLVVGSGAEAVTLDPGVSFDGQSILLWRAVYEPLVRYDGGSLDIVPHLAERYEVSEDGLTYTFRLRPGVKFSDGTPLDAAAVKFNIERQRNVEGGIGYALDPVVSVETPDDLTVVITLEEPFDWFLSVFAGVYTVSMISPAAVREHEQDGDWAQGWLRHNMVGTGPYLLESYVQSQQAVFRRNPDYWRGWEGPHFERIIVKYIQEPTTLRLLLERGEVDVALYLPDDVVESLDGKPGIQVTNEPSFNLYYIMLPNHVGPTQELKVRQAISHGFDYQTWVGEYMRGKAKQARGPLPSNFTGFSPETPQYSYDPDKARALLAEAGYPDGGFTLNYNYESGYWWKRPLGELFQSNMRDLGIEVEIQELAPSAWIDTLSNPETAEHAYGLVWWPTLASPADYLWALFATGAQGSGGWNWSYYSNPRVDEILATAPTIVDEARRNALYAELQRILVEDAPALYVYEKNYRLPMRDNVKGFVFNGVYIETLNFYDMYKE